MAHAWNPSYLGTEIRKIVVRGQPGQIVCKTHLQNNQSKMDWRCDSSGGAPALQVQSPEYKSQFHYINNK
jgi:hypothetical protein